MKLRITITIFNALIGACAMLIALWRPFISAVILTALFGATVFGYLTFICPVWKKDKK